MKIKKKYIFFGILIITILLTITIYLGVQASNITQGIESFPNSYQAYLKEIVKKHPNWQFKALYTNLDWNYVISEENIYGKNLVPKNYSDNWKNTTPGQYNVEVDKGWVDCSKRAIEYCMDPRNFLNEARIFQFETLSYDEYSNNLESIEKILYGTEFYNTRVSYLDIYGNTINMSQRYSELILSAGQSSRVSPYHLASRIKQEVGPFLSHSSISGNVEGYKGLYNFYNIGATSSSEPMGAIKKGLQYAKDGKGASQQIKDKYIIPWDTKQKAITGGAIFIGSSYINVGQNTIYLQKFDVNDQRSNNLFSHQYMTNVLAPYSEAKSIYNGYKRSGILDTPMTFIIPVYENMPNIPTHSPNINDFDFIYENKKVCSTASNLNIRTGPSTSYEIITSVDKEAIMTRIYKGNQPGERWDKVILENGIVGFVYQSYVSDKIIQIEEIKLNINRTTLNKGEQEKLQVTIFPPEANKNKIQYISSNPKVAVVDENGNIKAISSGKTIITVKSKENDVRNQIEITVYSPVTDILLEDNELYMIVGEKSKINTIVKPTDANNKTIKYNNTNEEIIQVEEDGTITAIKQGQAKIIISSDDNSNIKSECVVNVVEFSNEDIIFDETLTVDGLNISKIDYNENTVEDIIKKIKTSLTVRIVDYNNKELKLTDNVGTGCKVQIEKNGKIIRQYKIIIYGDASGDGKINSIDLLLIQRHILGLDQLLPIYLKASNINKDGRKPTSIDLLLIQRHILGFQEIKQ